MYQRYYSVKVDEIDGSNVGIPSYIAPPCAWVFPQYYDEQFFVSV